MSQLLANLGRFASRQASHNRNPALYAWLQFCVDEIIFFGPGTGAGAAIRNFCSSSETLLLSYDKSVNKFDKKVPLLVKVHGQFKCDKLFPIWAIILVIWELSLVELPFKTQTDLQFIYFVFRYRYYCTLLSTNLILTKIFGANR